MNDKSKLFYDKQTGGYFRMTKRELDEIEKEVDKLLRTDSIKKAEVATYWDFIEEFVNPYLPDDQKFVRGQSWNITPNSDDLPDFNLDDPFGIIAKF